MKIDGSSNSRKPPDPKVPSKASKSTFPSSVPQSRPSGSVQTFGDFSFDVDNVTSKFTKALQEKLNEEPASIATNGHYKYDGETDLDGVSRSRSDRIQAIKDTAATLQNRLKEEAEKIKAQSTYRNEGNL